MKPEPSRTVRKWILPLERRLCSHPLIVTSSPVCLPMSSIYTCISARSHELFDFAARVAGARERVFRRASCRQLEGQRAIVADFLHRRQRGRPVDDAVERDEVIVGAAAVVVQVDSREMSGGGF